MGITIKSPNHQVDIGYFGFAKIRHLIARMTNDEIASHYDKLYDFFSIERNGGWQEYDRKTDRLSEKYSQYSKVIEFLYVPDTDGSISPETCRQVLETIYKGTEDDFETDNARSKYGKKFCDFVLALTDCAENETNMEWS